MIFENENVGERASAIELLDTREYLIVSIVWVSKSKKELNHSTLMDNVLLD